jgi:hypothetical protein
MKRIKRHIVTAIAFLVGEMLVCLMLLTALVCKLTARLGKARPPY